MEAEVVQCSSANIYWFYSTWKKALIHPEMSHLCSSKAHNMHNVYLISFLRCFSFFFFERVCEENHFVYFSLKANANDSTAVQLFKYISKSSCIYRGMCICVWVCGERTNAHDALPPWWHIASKVTHLQALFGASTHTAKTANEHALSSDLFSKWRS